MQVKACLYSDASAPAIIHYLPPTVTSVRHLPYNNDGTDDLRLAGQVGGLPTGGSAYAGFTPAEMDGAIADADNDVVSGVQIRNQDQPRSRDLLSVSLVLAYSLFCIFFSCVLFFSCTRFLSLTHTLLSSCVLLCPLVSSCARSRRCRPKQRHKPRGMRLKRRSTLPCLPTKIAPNRPWHRPPTPCAPVRRPR